MKTETDRVEIRPTSAWGLAAIFGLPAGIMALSGVLARQPNGTTADNQATAGLLIIAVFTGMLAFGVALWAARAKVIADEAGLAWRGIGRWRRVAWTDVKDYYERLPPRNARHRPMSMVVETTAGTLVLGTMWSKTNALREVLPTRARQARCSEWSILDTRPIDEWPQTFSYLIRHEKRWLRAIGVLLPPAVALWVLVASAVGYLSIHEMGWIVGLVSFCFCILWLGVLPGVQLKIILSALQDRLLRAQQTIVIDPYNITFSDGSRIVAARWNQVSNYYRQGQSFGLESCVVETEHGTFDFTHNISDVMRLRRIIERYATDAKSANKWRRRDFHERLGTEMDRWTSGAPGLGAQVFHYRTRTSRALLAFVVALAPLFALSPFLSRYSTGRVTDRSPWYMAAVLTVFALYLWWRYRRAAVLVSDAAISQRTPWGLIEIPWPDVTEYHKTELGATVIGIGKRVWFFDGISDHATLMQEIQKRAVNSRTKGWQPRG